MIVSHDVVNDVLRRIALYRKFVKESCVPAASPIGQTSSTCTCLLRITPRSDEVRRLTHARNRARCRWSTRFAYAIPSMSRDRPAAATPLARAGHREP
ncbi:hypothetical protein [Burkholderia lata]|uniref:hypothetical protein n=1 Tax=Burkholderia lata (strain ATCC 17760 / DSM 23089 / LMG 22485 / NCIMB 9086 / R18194 / 383) TaxID=482957 RepID=UPI00399B88EE